MARPTPLDRLGRELEAAAERQIAAAPTASGVRRWRRGTLVLAVLALLAAAAAASWAATSLLSSGSPVPFARGAPIAGRALGAPIPATVRMLADDVADPGGGPPWGLRYWETDRKYACIQVGRVHDSKLGQIGAGNVFHELRLGVARAMLGECVLLDGGGHAFVALHTDAQRGGQPPPCLAGFRLGSTVKVNGGRVRCTFGRRTVDFGLLGPNAKGLTYRSGGRDRTAPALGGVGGYLVVQKRLRPVMREFGFHHRNPRLNLHGPAEPYLALTPASQVVKRVEYAGGTCVVRITLAPNGACGAQAGVVPIPQPEVGDVRARVRAFAAPAGRGIRVRFRARQAVVDARSDYNIEVRPVGGQGFMTQSYSHDVAAGALVAITVDLYNHRRGAYRIVVRYRTVRARPGRGRPTSGRLVGETRVVVP